MTIFKSIPCNSLKNFITSTVCLLYITLYIFVENSRGFFLTVLFCILGIQYKNSYCIFSKYITDFEIQNECIIDNKPYLFTYKIHYIT